MFTGIQFSGYKLFCEENYIKFDKITNLNVIIGKNNSGKSSLLDVIEMAYDETSFEKQKRQIGSIKVRIPMTKDMVQDIFSGYRSIGEWNAENYWEKVEGRNALIEFGATKNSKNSKGYFAINTGNIPLENESYFQRGLYDFKEEKQNYIFRRLSAERNIVPEKEMDLELSSTGEGASNLVRVFLNDSTYDERVIEGQLLSALNEIMYPEAEFESIRIQQIKMNDGYAWEIYLKEKGRERVPLSKSGSGIKTIILVLLNLIVVPRQPQNIGKTIVYGFEELENNLHPAMQRKLFDYIYEFAVENNLNVFITTHSHVAINTFFDKEKACIYHVVKENEGASLKRIESYIDKTEILDDLDIKASDILQANGIIWVEGPSDRIYIKKWLEIFCNNQFEEGKHYQFLYYGGRLLSQYSAEEETDLISIITTNRNAAIVMDSDKRYQAAPLNDTKKRIIEEFDKLDMFCWVTKGKEIENYIPKEAVESMSGKAIRKKCEKYDLFPDYIKSYYNNFTNKKVPFANEIKDYITEKNSLPMLDLKVQIEKLYKSIKKWNE
ncbi:MAG: ATP-binding protein [Lachnospiraceae bacterium]|nr:ATP-binding protein [Lachnospiraceae bacterium]